MARVGDVSGEVASVGEGEIKHPQLFFTNKFVRESPPLVAGLSLGASKLDSSRIGTNWFIVD